MIPGLGTYEAISVQQAMLQGASNAYNQQQLLGAQCGQAIYSSPSLAQMQQEAAAQQYKHHLMRIQGDALAAKLEADKRVYRTTKTETKVNTDKEILPDISLTRVLKWAVVLLIAMGLGRRVWDTFGHKIKEQLEGALKEVL